MPGALITGRSPATLWRSVRRLLALGMLTFGALLALGLPASAHADLLSSSPANGAVLAAVPQQVVLVFSDQVTSALSSVRVTGPDGRRADTGPAQDAPAESERLTVTLGPDSHPGTYVLVWRATTANDGHTTTGTLTFSVGSPDHPAAAVPRPAHDAVTDAVLDTTVWLGLAGLALLVGGAALRFCRPGRPVDATAGVEPEGARWPRSLGWGVLLTATVAQLFVHGPAGQGHPLTKVFDRALLSATLETREGYALVARILLLAVVAAVGEALLRRPWGAAPAAVLVLVLGTTWSATSHASTGSWQPLALLSTTVHLTAMAVWAGGLFGMVLLLGSGGADADAERRVIAARFSRLALVAVAVLAGTGLYQAFREVSGFSELTGTSYGRLVLIKTGILAVVIAVAAVGRARLARRTANSPYGLRRIVVLELVGIAALLIATVLLISTPPARDASTGPQAHAPTTPARP